MSSVRLGRRAFTLGSAAGLSASWLAGCDCNSTTAPPSSRPSGARGPAPGSQERWREWSIEPSPQWTKRQHAVVLAVKGAPTVIALHGAGEAARGTVAGARGWRDDYDLDVAHQRASSPPLTASDFHGFVNAERLQALNASLAAHPYEGLTVVCPYAPRLGDRSVEGAAPYGRWLTEVLLARVGSELGSAPKRSRSGIDGVSMGGRLALLIGLTFPESFAAVGALQPAIASGEAPMLSELAAKASSVGSLLLRLVTSEDDPFRGPVEALSKRLDQDGVKHQMVVTPGPHDYVWNQGPGSYELLLWHERVLRGLPAP